MKLIDMKDMPNYNPEVKNGIDDVSMGQVFFGRCEWMWEECLETVCCIEHGAMNPMTDDKDGRIWRCIICNRGAFEIMEEK